MTPDNELLRQYAESGSESAFAELARRYVSLVYSAAWRQVNGDSALAEDVAQSVFIDLARKARQLTGHATLAGWVHTSVRFAALRALRDQRRRQIREQEVLAMNQPVTSPDIVWEEVQPLLDEAVAALGDRDREAVLLRYFQGWSHREVAAALNLSEDAARMRVDRALEKMRGYLSQRGVKTTASLLATAIPLNSVQAVPADLAVKLAGASVAHAAGAGAANGGVAGLRGLATMKSRALFAVAAIIAVIAGSLLWPTPQAKPANDQPPTIVATELPHPVAVTPPPAVSPPSTSVAPPTNNIPIAVAPAEPPSPTVSPVVEPPTPPVVPDLPAPVIAPAPVAPPVIADTFTLSTLIAANNQFALDLFREASPNADENAFLSSYSLSTALAMTWAGARGETAAQMAKMLRFTGLSPNDVSQGFGTLQRALARAQTNSGAQLALADSLWPDIFPEHPFSAEYLDWVQTDFSSALTPVDFKNRPDDGRRQINAWIADKTAHKITDVLQPLDVDSSTRLLLIDAISFQGQWANAFLPGQTRAAPFHRPGAGNITVAMMRGTFLAQYADLTDVATPCQILSLAYYDNVTGARPRDAQGISFIAVLPRTATDLDALEKSLTTDQLAAWLGHLATTRVQILLPKFSLNQRYLLNNHLHALGLVNAFVIPDPADHPRNANAADFSGMNDYRNLALTKIIQATAFDVTENDARATVGGPGFGAGGAGGRGGGAGGARGGGAPPGAAAGAAPPSLPIFQADHPFLFLIRDDATGSILFLGRLTNPPLAPTGLPPIPANTRGRVAGSTPAASSPVSASIQP